MADVYGLTSRWNAPLDLANAVPLTTGQGTWAPISVTNAMLGAAHANIASDAQNDQAAWVVDLSAGTWTVAIVGVAFPTAAIATVEISYNGSTWTTLGTIDFYAASLTQQKRTVFTGISVPRTGPAQLRFTAATRNASNTTHWFLELSKADFTRTA